MKTRHSCELCGAAASLHCEADSAYLCFSCDAKVHGANFLVARHVRRLSCNNCNSLTAGEFSGGGSAPARPLCASCDDTAASDSGGGRRRRRRPPPLAVLERWSRSLGERVGRTAAHVVGECRGAMAGVPPRAVLAAALWYAAKARGCKSERVLRRLEECSGVPAKIIVRVAERLARRLVKVEEEEGWSEC